PLIDWPVKRPVHGVDLRALAGRWRHDRQGLRLPWYRQFLFGRALNRQLLLRRSLHGKILPWLSLDRERLLGLALDGKCLLGPPLDRERLLRHQDDLRRRLNRRGCLLPALQLTDLLLMLPDLLEDAAPPRQYTLRPRRTAHDQ